MSDAILSQAYAYDLPPERIAQRPVQPYDLAKMLVIDREASCLSDSVFADLPARLRAGDLLIFNDSRVTPARFIGKIEETGAQVEVLVLDGAHSSRRLCLGKPLKKFKAGGVLSFAGGLKAKILERVSEQEVRLEFCCDDMACSLFDKMQQVGLMPIPPYIRRGLSDEADRKDYQSMFAKFEGSIAAPTASLHFTPELISRLCERGCEIDFVTLHVGTASFLPLWNADHSSGAPELKPPGRESYTYSARLLARILEIKKNGGRVIAVGTTVVRALESMARLGLDEAREGARIETELFLYPGCGFQAADALITNFHQPRTTHLLLVQAFMGGELLAGSYAHALAHGYRFLSYGDGMFIY